MIYFPAYAAEDHGCPLSLEHWWLQVPGLQVLEKLSQCTLAQLGSALGIDTEEGNISMAECEWRNGQAGYAR